MEVTIWRFSAGELARIHREHLGFLLASSHCCNELISLMPYIIFEQDITEANEAESALINIRFFTIVRHQISKIFEYRDLCNEYIGQIRKSFPARALTLQRTAGDISRRIDAASWARTVRNKVAFHFDSEYVHDALNRVDPDQKLSFIAGRVRGVTAFDFVDRILTEAMFKEAGKGDASVGRDVVMKWTIELQRSIEKFHSDVTIQIFEQYGLFDDRAVTAIRDSWCGNPTEIAVPLAINKVTGQ